MKRLGASTVAHLHRSPLAHSAPSPPRLHKCTCGLQVVVYGASPLARLSHSRGLAGRRTRGDAVPRCCIRRSASVQPQRCMLQNLACACVENAADVHQAAPQKRSIDMAGCAPGQDDTFRFCRPCSFTATGGHPGRFHRIGAGPLSGSGGWGGCAPPAGSRARTADVLDMASSIDGFSHTQEPHTVTSWVSLECVGGHAGPPRCDRGAWPFVPPRTTHYSTGAKSWRTVRRSRQLDALQQES